MLTVITEEVAGPPSCGRHAEPAPRLQRLAPLRHQQRDFFVADIVDASPKDDLASMEHPLFALKAGDRRVRSYARNGLTVTIKPGVDGCATIHDKDLWIYCISQLVEALNREREDVSRTVRFTAYDFLITTNRPTAGVGYGRMVEALRRLKGTVVNTVRLMAPKFVIPYRLSGKRGKNDAADAAAICEAVTRPSMRFVPIKSIEQQGQLLVHRARQGFVEQRTATFNRIRGLLSELGIVLPLKAAVVRREATAHLEDLPGWANTVIGDLLSEVSRLDERIAQYDRHIQLMARQSAQAQRLMQLCGVGETTATALLSTIGNGRDFKCGRQLCAWLGLVPGQYSSGGKQRLGRITKAGDPYLRSLLVLGARAVLAAAKNKSDPISRWATALAQRRGYWKAIVAIAAKNARMCWAVLSRGDDFKLPA